MDVERVDVERSLALNRRIPDKSLLWRAFDLYLLPFVIAVQAVVFFAWSLPLLGAIALAFSAFVAWRARRLPDLRRIELPLEREEARTATIAAIRALGWIVDGDYASYAAAVTPIGFWEPGRSIVVLYGDRCLLFNSVQGLWKPFSSLPGRDFAAFHAAIEERLAGILPPSAATNRG